MTKDQPTHRRIRLVYMTAGSMDEAAAIAKRLVAQGLAACVNLIDGMRSIYQWDGQVQDDRETVMIAKTSADRIDELVDAVKSMHSYDCPCIVALTADDGNRDFLDWVAKQVDERSTEDD